MAKIITVNRKYLSFTMGVVILFLVGFATLGLLGSNQASVSKTDIVPAEVKMLSVNFEPASITKDLTYGSVTLKGVKVVPAKTFDLIATVQNTTSNKMTNVPIELEETLVGNDQQKVTKLGNIPVLEPGAQARITFSKIRALGDGLGKSATAGQHSITIRIKTNPAGGLTQSSETNFRFYVDSTVKVPAQDQKN